MLAAAGNDELASKISKTRIEDDAESALEGTHPLPMAHATDSGDARLQDSAPDRDGAVTSPAQLHPGHLLRDRYLLQERLPNGTMGVVFKAVDRYLSDAAGADVLVAVKVLAPEVARDADALRALQQEAAKGRFLSHPNIVRFIDLDREGDLHFIVMEWLDGQSLGELLDGKELTTDKARIFDIVRQVAEALEYAHKRGVIHADIKPANIMLLPDGTAKLIDFGIARARQKGCLELRDTVAVKAATPAYSSLQVLTGEEPVAADDVFALACLIYRLIAGHRVYGPRNAMDAANEGMKPQRPPSLTDSEWRALEKGLSYTRRGRQQTPLQLMAELYPRGRAASNDRPLHVPADEVLKRRRTDRPLRWPLYALFLVLMGAAAVYWLQPQWLPVGLDRLSGVIAAVRERVVSQGAERVPASDTREGNAALPPEVPPQLPPQPAPEPAATVAAGAAPALPELNEVQELPAAAVQEAVQFEAELAPAASVASGPLRLLLAGGGRPMSRLSLTMAEDGEPTVIELERQDALTEPLLVRIDEVGFSGLRSPGKAGEYRLSDNGVVSFDAGQAEAMLTIEAISNAEREPDRQISLRLRDYYDAESTLAQIDLRLLDDDQRAFESGIPKNSVSFAADRTVVAERDPAVQIELLRFNPDNNAQVVVYYVRDASATEGEDFFAPTQRVITFGPGQRNARLLIPLVQDTVAEGDERFTVELDQEASHERTINSISVIVRDDDFFDE